MRSIVWFVLSVALISQTYLSSGMSPLYWLWFLLVGIAKLRLLTLYFCFADCEKHCRSPKAKQRLNFKRYCKKDYTIQVHVLHKQLLGEWMQFTVNVVSVFKRRGSSPARHGDLMLWVPARDAACRCPRFQPGRKYLVLGTESNRASAVGREASRHGGLTLGRSSVVMQWRDQWARRLRKYHHRDKKGRCSKP
uniref:NTR domain-containing protein n=1 Tax=Eptatretus burgeri TaxID=7764 RepID=A0A8C4N3H2_EPTBU